MIQNDADSITPCRFTLRTSPTPLSERQWERVRSSGQELKRNAIDPNSVVAQGISGQGKPQKNERGKESPQDGCSLQQKYLLDKSWISGRQGANRLNETRWDWNPVLRNSKPERNGQQ
jgi:hypothetical protein